MPFTPVAINFFDNISFGLEDTFTFHAPMSHLICDFIPNTSGSVCPRHMLSSTSTFFPCRCCTPKSSTWRLINVIENEFEIITKMITIVDYYDILTFCFNKMTYHVRTNLWSISKNKFTLLVFVKELSGKFWKFLFRN